jgi:DNA-binding transcriptional ArsR family regulator
MNAFTALADPTRVKIFELIVSKERSAGEIVSHFNFKAPTISQHLTVLKEAHLVSVRAEGQKRIYSADPVGLNEIRAWMDKMSGEWSGNLDALERVLSEDDWIKTSHT